LCPKHIPAHAPLLYPEEIMSSIYQQMINFLIFMILHLEILTLEYSKAKIMEHGSFVFET
jgi:hypothetical protein